jgi:hypothetical protein
LMGLPRSALPPAVLTERLKDEETLMYGVYSLILILPAQIATIWACFRPYVVTSYQSGLLLAITACYFSVTYFGSCYQRYYAERDALHGRADDCIAIGYNDSDNDDDYDRSTTGTELTNTVDGASGDGSNDRVNMLPVVVFDQKKDPITKNC